ncbi:MAG: RsmE family RNA methyltransferase [Spirochaeta sp.]|nr:RsmE family RNA methyltransferase [Spirochaeta sp.]
MNRVLFEAGELEQPLLRSDPRGRHILKVLNADVGDRIRVGIINGPAGTASFRELTHDYLILEPETLNETPPALFPITVVLGHTRPIVLQRVLRDLTTIGVGHIIVTHTELGEKSYFLSNLWQQDAYRAFLIEGAAQAGCTRLPRVERARFLGEACELLPSPNTHTRFAFDLPLVCLIPTSAFVV